ncbi:NRDE family protein [Thermomonospora amylolytica]|uniref:NRDE family protein n=1 Tax=Thermomonospora amylolytica TaxID=1411117 RepID=UPI000E6C186A|nr:NRDE family protein [Thermomonospora amylolytica]
MCTAVVAFDPLSPFPVLLAGVRDEFADRPWLSPGPHWPDRPGLIGGRDLQAGGTWLAVDPGAPRVACVLNGHGRPAPPDGRISRGELPLRAAATGEIGDLDLTRVDPFHLVCAEPTVVRLCTWDGVELAERKLPPGLHMIVNTGLEGRGPRGEVHPDAAAQMAERIAHFRPLLEAAPRPEPRAGTAAEAWGAWLPLVEGGGLDRADRRALVLSRDFGDGRLWGTSSVSLVALAQSGVRYDFTAGPGDGNAWTTVLSSIERDGA